MDNVYIQSVPVNLFNGIFNTVISFNNGLNIISGVNGTGKTQLLQFIKNNNVNISDINKKSSELAIFAISPKRNTEKQAIESIVQQVRSQSKTIQTFFENIGSFQIKDSGFENYPSLVELFIQEYESVMQDGATGHAQAISDTTTKFNEILHQVFPDYEIEAQWIIGSQGVSGKLDLKIKKYSADSINIDFLSTGEREVFALLFCIFVSRAKEDIYLIDEPETHLNWDLENGLFHFFDWFCETFEKQIIVVTHSRIIFKKEFYPKTQFLLWENGTIVCRREISKEQRTSIAGEIAETVNIVQFDKTTFFVEDNTQKIVTEILAKNLKKEVEVIVCENKSSVKSFYSLLKNKNENIYFLVDRDNEGCGISDSHFISLSKYCIENYFLDISTLSVVLSKTDNEVRAMIVECIKANRLNKYLVVYKKLAEIASPFPFEVLDTYNGKELLKLLSQKVNKPVENLIDDFLVKVIADNRAESIFGEIMIGLK